MCLESTPAGSAVAVLPFIYTRETDDPQVTQRMETSKTEVRGPGCHPVQKKRLLKLLELSG